MTGAAADVTMKFDGKTTDMLWAIWISPEVAITSADSVSVSFTLSMGGMCGKWASTEEGGEGAINCL